MSSSLFVSRRNRRTPFTDRIEAHGVTGFSIVNHTLLPKSFGRSVEEDYWHLREHVQLWDVSCQRQVEIQGKDAKKLVQRMTPRDLSKAEVGQCLYAPLIDENAGMINDPVILKRAEDWYWMSIADSDVLLWAKGLSLGMDLEVQIQEPDVSPLAVQGPKAEILMSRVFGKPVTMLKFFHFGEYSFEGRKLVIARSGYSRQGGFEIYLDQTAMGGKLWDTLWEAGKDLDVSPGCPNLIERVEGGLLSYGNEMTRGNNPLECNLERYCNLDGTIDCVGMTRLREVAKKGIQQRIRGIVFEGEASPPCGFPWPLIHDAQKAGYTTTVVWSPRLKTNLALAMVRKEFWETNQELLVELPDGTLSKGFVTDLPFKEMAESIG